MLIEIKVLVRHRRTPDRQDHSLRDGLPILPGLRRESSSSLSPAAPFFFYQEGLADYTAAFFLCSSSTCKPMPAIRQILPIFVTIKAML